MNKTTVAQQAKASGFLPPAQGILQRKCACGNHTLAGGECAECAKKKSGLQRKLAIGSSNDPLEREADRVADQVMAASSHPTVNSTPPHVQRYAGQATEGTDTAPASVDRVLASSGRPLDVELQQDMEQRFGHDFSSVRVHSGGAAEQSTREVNAHAYTVGHNIVFGAGEFEPDTDSGKRLLAHELVHVIQQSPCGRVLAPTAERLVSQPTDSAEQEADRVADAVNGFSVVVPQINESPRVVARKPLNLSQIDQAINQATSAVPQLGLGWLQAILPQLLGHQNGEIAFAANYPGGAAPKKQPALPVPKADKVPVPVDTSLPIEAHFFPSGRLMSTERALILGGFHGDERPGWEVVEALVTELSKPATSTRPLFFHTVVVPRVNAGAIADELGGLHFWGNRCNRQIVDLNRNFPTGGTPKDTDCANTDGAPRQPEVQGVIDLIKAFKP